MKMGHYLAKDIRLDHRRFDEAKTLVSARGEKYFYDAQRDIGTAIEHLYGSKEQSLQRLAATFRRGDLLEVLATLSDLATFDDAPVMRPPCAEKWPSCLRSPRAWRCARGGCAAHAPWSAGPR
jgi:hypothetical protein